MKHNYEQLKEKVGPGVFTQWQKVDVEIYAFTDVGIKVAINNEYTGLVYKNQIYEDYQEGERLKAYIQCVREDGKIDISLQPNQGIHIPTTTEKILKHLKAAGGKSMFNDKSSPEDIKKVFQVSKKVFKQAIGSLYKKGVIKITDKGIELVRK